MLKKTITYKDYNDLERTEDFYFNLTKAEITEWEMSQSGGMSALLTRITAEQDIPKLVKIFKQIIIKSFGVKSDDGKRFVKSPEILADFMATEAYSQLFMELAGDAKAAADFANAIVPSDMIPQPGNVIGETPSLTGLSEV